MEIVKIINVILMVMLVGATIHFGLENQEINKFILGFQAQITGIETYVSSPKGSIEFYCPYVINKVGEGNITIANVGGSSGNFNLQIRPKDVEFSMSPYFENRTTAHCTDTILIQSGDKRVFLLEMRMMGTSPSLGIDLISESGFIPGDEVISLECTYKYDNKLQQYIPNSRGSDTGIVPKFETRSRDVETDCPRPIW